MSSRRSPFWIPAICPTSVTPVGWPSMTTGRLSVPSAGRTTISRLWDQAGPTAFVSSTRAFVEAASGAAATWGGANAETFQRSPSPHRR